MNTSLRILFIWALFSLGLERGSAQTGAFPAVRSSQTRVYRISPTDLLHLKVFQEDDMETKVRVAADGSVTLPLLGNVYLGGKTVDEATAMVRQELARDYFVNPQVTLVVLEYSKRRFTVLGQVQKPGSYEIPSEEVVTFNQAIATAGGFNRLANKRKVTVTRQVGGKTTMLSIDARESSNESQTFEILPGDTITVPEGLL
jgi:polysaccharide export outer membrane protein